jgi:hypothetical protein
MVYVQTGTMNSFYTTGSLHCTDVDLACDCLPINLPPQAVGLGWQRRLPNHHLFPPPHVKQRLSPERAFNWKSLQSALWSLVMSLSPQTHNQELGTVALKLSSHAAVNEAEVTHSLSSESRPDVVAGRMQAALRQGIEDIGLSHSQTN